MKLKEIKYFVDLGYTVYWSNRRYTVTKDDKGRYFIKCDTGDCIGLTWLDGITLNGKESEFCVTPETEQAVLLRLAHETGPAYIAKLRARSGFSTVSYLLLACIPGALIFLGLLPLFSLIP